MSATPYGHWGCVVCWVAALGCVIAGSIYAVYGLISGTDPAALGWISLGVTAAWLINWLRAQAVVEESLGGDAEAGRPE